MQQTQFQVPVPYGYSVKKRLSVHNDKEIYVIESAGGTLYVWKIFQMIYKYPLYESLQKTEHPGIPKIYEAVRLDDCFYIIEEYIDGETLHDILAEHGAMNAAQSLPVLTRVCDVLAYLHNQPTPIIHRDITPNNIMLTQNGTVKLLDFDIAREYRANAPKDTEVAGTKPFAPPEQYGFAQSDHRSDIYALGILLTVMLTNGFEPKDITDTHLRRVALRCTAFTPGKRYKNIKQLKKHLLSPRLGLLKHLGLGAVSVIVMAVFIIIMLRRMDIGSHIGVDDGSLPDFFVASIDGGKNTTAVAPGGANSFYVYLFDRYGNKLCSYEEPVTWTVEGLLPGENSWETRENMNSGFAIELGHSTTERMITVTATSVSNPSVYRVFTTHVSAEYPSVGVGNPVPTVISSPGYITFPVSASNLPDGVYEAGIHITYPNDEWFDVLVPRSFWLIDPVYVWFDGLVEIIDGAGEIIFIFDDSDVRIQRQNIYFVFGLRIPPYGTIFDWGGIRIR